MRVFLDANVLFSASKSDSAIARMVGWICENGEAVTSDVALEEARRNLVLKRPAWISDFEALSPTLEVVSSTIFDLPVKLADKDIPILCAAIAAACPYFITGDKRDFGALYGQTIMGTHVSSLSQFAEILRLRTKK